LLIAMTMPNSRSRRANRVQPRGARAETLGRDRLFNSRTPGMRGQRQVRPGSVS